jgi:hypothetical protein
MQAAVGYLRVSTQEQGETQRHCAWDSTSAARSLSLMEGPCGQLESLVMAQLFTLACLPQLPTLHNRI